MKGIAIYLILLALSAATLATEKIPPMLQSLEGKAHSKDWQSLAVDPTQPRRFVELTQDLELLCQPSGGGSSTRSLMVFKGVYPIERRLHDKKSEMDWLIVPATTSQPVVFGHNNSAGRTWGYEHAIVLNPESLTIFPREMVRFTQEWTRLNGSRWNEKTWAFGCVPSVVNEPTQSALRFITEEQFEAIRNGQARQVAREAIEKKAQHELTLNRERPLKSKIGVQLCRKSGAWILQGFTEGRSPDNEKLQIRIWRASLSDSGHPGTVTPSDFRESIVWDSPDNWNLCE